MKQNLTIEILRKYGIIIALSLVLFLSVVDIFFVTVASSRTERIENQYDVACQSIGGNALKDTSRISQIKGPTITKKAAYSICQTEKSFACGSLDSGVWVFVFISYMALLIFNLAYGFTKGSHIQWVWETTMTGIFLSLWFLFDSCAQNIWYPLYVVKLAIAIYIAYLYFFLNREEKMNQ